MSRSKEYELSPSYKQSKNDNEVSNDRQQRLDKVSRPKDTEITLSSIKGNTSHSKNGMRKEDCEPPLVENGFLEINPPYYGRYLRRSLLNTTSKEVFKEFKELLRNDTKSEPKLLISCFGGARFFSMSEALESEFINQIGALAGTKGVWLLTTGMNAGVSRLIGRAVQRHRLLYENKTKPVLIGLQDYGVLSKYMRDSLGSQYTESFGVQELVEKQPCINVPDNNWDMLDKYHSHFLLLDFHNIGFYLNDESRSDFVQTICSSSTNNSEVHVCRAVTIIIEGGAKTIEVIENDLKRDRPVIIIQGSGRLADFLGILLKDKGENDEISNEEILQQLQRFTTLDIPNEQEAKDFAKQIQNLFRHKNRRLLKVYRIDDRKDLKDVVFEVVLQSQETKAREREEIESFLRIAVEWNFLKGAHELLENTKAYSDNTCTHEQPRLIRKCSLCTQYWYNKLFDIVRNMDSERPGFIDYLFCRYYNPLLECGDKNRLVTISVLDFLEKLYPCECDKSIFHVRLHLNYASIIGPYFDSFYINENIWVRLRHDICRFFGEQCNQNKYLGDQSLKPLGKEEMLRDLLLWCVRKQHSGSAIVILLYMKSRVGAALLGTTVARKMASLSKSRGKAITFESDAQKYAAYASECINACYEANAERTHRLLISKKLIYGNVTYMQVAYASAVRQFFITTSVDGVLTERWFEYPKAFMIKTLWEKFLLMISIIMLGFPAPFIFSEEVPEKAKGEEDKERLHDHYEGNDYLTNKTDVKRLTGETYLKNLVRFHQSPVIKMFYDMLFYIFFLITFAYTLLFHTKSINKIIHWTTIYILVTVFAMLIDDVRDVTIEYYNRMLEMWQYSNSRELLSVWLQKFLWHVLPYILFFTGIGILFSSLNTDSSLYTAKILLAICYEWYCLKSIRYLSAFKFFGPKLYMIQRMGVILIAFLYIMLIFEAAYGVVSTSLTATDSIKLNAQSIFYNVFFYSYWLMYSIDNGKIQNMTDIIESEDSTQGAKSAATVNHILLTFHTILINILILNLIIAVFGQEIDRIQDDNKYYWNRQRYRMIREYYEKPLFSYPPVSLVANIILLVTLIVMKVRGSDQRLLSQFKFDSEKIDGIFEEDFEYEATYNYARGFVEQDYRKKLGTEQNS